MIDRLQAARLFQRLMSLIKRFDMALFSTDQAEEIGLNNKNEEAEALGLMRKTGDLLKAFARFTDMSKYDQSTTILSWLSFMCRLRAESLVN